MPEPREPSTRRTRINLSRPTTARWILATTFALALSGCGSDSVKPFELFSLDGKQTYTLDSYKGKVLMLDYWATWCGPCHQLQPTIKELAAMYGKRGLVVLGVSDESPKVVADFVKHAPLGYEPAIDRGDRVGTEFNVRGLPTIILIDRDGSLLYNHAAPDMVKVGQLLDKLMPAQ